MPASLLRICSVENVIFDGNWRSVPTKREKKEEMPSRDLAEDTSFFLYLAPIVASIIYGAYEWNVIGHGSSTMPGVAYLIVSKSPYLYLFSIIVVFAALLIEVRGAPSSQRESVIVSNATRLQILSVVVLIISFAAALSSSNYDFANGFSVFIAGRYALIFAFSIVLFSLLLAPRQMIGTAKMSSVAEIIGLLLLAASPVVLYGEIKVHIDFGVSAIVAIIVAIIGAYLFFNNTRLMQRRTSQPTKSAQRDSPLVRQPESATPRASQ